MAYTRIHAIKATVGKSIDYITDPDKTDGQIYVSSYACSPKTAHLEFAFAAGKTSHINDNKAYHLIQSFAPGEVSFDMAHDIGKQLADRLLEGKYSYVLTTHIEKDHVHNHLIFSATTNTDHTKYNACKKSYNNIRKISDELCAENGLSVISSDKKHGKKYIEWKSEKNGTSWKVQLKNDIDECIIFSKSYSTFIELMKAKGYEIKGTDLSNSNLKYISFKSPYSKRFIRGSDKSLGYKYTKENINKRIEYANKRHSSFPTKKKFVDANSESIKSSTHLQKWANFNNMQAAASAYASAGSMTDLEESIAAKKAIVQTAKASLNDIEKQMSELGEILKYADIYKQTKRYHIAYKKSKNPDAYLRDRRNNHEANLILYDGAIRFLESHGINPDALNVSELHTKFDSLNDKKAQITSTLESTRADISSMEEQFENMQQYFGRDKDISKSKNKESQI